MEGSLLIVQSGIVAALAAWMAVAVADNWRHPQINLRGVREVMSMDLLAHTDTEAFGRVGCRRIVCPVLTLWAYRAIVAWETVAALWLGAGAICLGAAAFGLGGAEMARAVALLGVGAFTLNWAGFLIGGNWFCYWLAHGTAQATHMALAIWGTLVMVLLAVPT